MALPQTFQLLGLCAFALLLQGRDGRAASLHGTEGASPMAKIYPRGSHWAVGHFMGKKSTRDFPYLYEEHHEVPFALLPDNVQQLGGSLRQEEAFKELLKHQEENENQHMEVVREEVPFPARDVWESEEENSSFKDMMALLLQMMDRKDNTPS